ncbi:MULTISPECIES: hypothetical protein [Streptomyces]|uniref:hypothetical protein n=1 Tax=Streptomyces TaxID=1883 RepID=UPI0014891C66|nr:MULTISPECIES: hypothetical protein [Streptomyces]
MDGDIAGLPALVQAKLSANSALFAGLAREAGINTGDSHDARLRFFITCDHSPDQIRRAVAAAKRLVGEVAALRWCSRPRWIMLVSGVLSRAGPRRDSGKGTSEGEMSGDGTISHLSW